LDGIGNRKCSCAGDGRWGENLRYSQYSANSLNQYTAHTVSGAVEIVGSATNNATVRVNNLSAIEKATITGARSPWTIPLPRYTNLAVLNQGTNADITGNIFIPQTPEIFQYDLEGNLTNDGHWVYLWDAENQLVNMMANSNIPSAAKLKLDFAYDYRRRRTGKIIPTWNGAGYVCEKENFGSLDRFLNDGFMKPFIDVSVIREQMRDALKNK
jgi:hypothetical protein